MFENIENLKLISSNEGIASLKSRVQCRKYHAFIIRTSGAGMYVFGEKTVVLKEGQMIFLPRGISYEFKSLPGKECRYMSVSFTADIEYTGYAVYSATSLPDAEYIINSFPTLWKTGGNTEKLKCYSLFYNLLSYVSEMENLGYADRKKLSVIDPAVDYLKKHMFDVSLKVDELHGLCGISDTYFRRLFIARFGTSPQKYVINKRISHARAVIDSGDCVKISEVAFLVGYSDPLYFSKAFKKKYGVSPSAVMNDEQAQPADLSKIKSLRA